MNPSSSEPLVVARGLTKRFGNLTAVDPVDFAIQPGEVVGFLGPNGAGKTTTIRMVTCTSPLSDGSLLVFGLDVTSHPREIKAQIGVVPQEMKRIVAFIRPCIGGGVIAWRSDSWLMPQATPL